MTENQTDLDRWLARARDQYQSVDAPTEVLKSAAVDAAPRTSRSRWAFVFGPVAALIIATMYFKESATIDSQLEIRPTPRSLSFALPAQPTIVAPSLSGARSVALPSVPLRAPKPSRDPAATTTQQQPVL